MIPDDQTVFMYRPSRWMEYGMQFYRFNRAQGVWSRRGARNRSVECGRKLSLSPTIRDWRELGEIAGVEIKIVTTVGNQSVFWVNRKNNVGFGTRSTMRASSESTRTGFVQFQNFPPALVNLTGEDTPEGDLPRTSTVRGTRSGSKCVPAHRRISSAASLKLTGALYGRL